VMKTTGAMGEIVGLAASLCAEHDCDPRAVHAEHWDELEGLMRLGSGRLEPVEESDGAFTLHARTAAVRGPSLRYEADQDCLGYWRSPRAHAEWAIQVPEAGERMLFLTYACDPSEAGWTAEVRVDGVPAARVRLASTGSWTEYARVPAGRALLSPGPHRITLHGDKPAGPLMKLRLLELVAED